jgi:hypothetical protein
MGVVVVVSMRGGIRQLSQDRGSTRREVKGHTPTPTTTSVRGEEEDGEMGESAEFDFKFSKMRRYFVFSCIGGDLHGRNETKGFSAHFVHQSLVPIIHASLVCGIIQTLRCGLYRL